jgi:Ca2+-binding EF-hand superfamily protein
LETAVVRATIALTGLIVSLPLAGSAQPQNKPAKQPPPGLLALLQSTPDQFIKRLDKNMDGVLTRNELPPVLAKNFEKWDRNGDGQLNRDEVGQMLTAVRTFLGFETPATPVAKNKPQVEKIIDNILLRMDTNKDGKISRAEAKNQIAANFERLDKNKDGYLDRAELRVIATRFAGKLGKGANGGPNPKAGPAQTSLDFDALDANADGRLTRDELKGSPLLKRFDEIDANRDGQIDRREFEAFLKKDEKRQE